MDNNYTILNLTRNNHIHSKHIRNSSTIHTVSKINHNTIILMGLHRELTSIQMLVCSL